MGRDEALALFNSHYLGNSWKVTPLAEAAETAEALAPEMGKAYRIG